MDHHLRTGSERAYAADIQRAADLNTEAIEQYAELLHSSPLDSHEEERIRFALADCLVRSGRLAEVEAVIAALTGDKHAPVVRARALTQIVRAKIFLGNLDEAQKAGERAVKLLQTGAEHAHLSDALRWLGHTLLQAARPMDAAESYRDSLAAARRIDDQEREAHAHGALGSLYRQLGLCREAVGHHRRSSQQLAELGVRDALAAELLHLGLAELYVGQWLSAGDSLTDGMRLAAEVKRSRVVALCHVGISRLRLRQLRLDEAAESAEEARAIGDGAHRARTWVLATESIGDVELTRGNAACASDAFESALSAAREISPTGDLVYEIEWRLGLAYLELGRLVEADELCRDAVNLARAGSDPRETGNALSALARVQAARGDDAFFDTIHEALTIFRELQLPWELAETYLTAARLCREANRGEPGAWLAYEHSARRLRARLGLEADVDGADPTVASPEPMTVVLENGVELLARSPSMVRMIETARDLAQIDNTVLIQGETGTGKELIARLIHDDGPRREKPFVAINCAAIAESLLESELFGHRRGAFTGADRDRRGHLVAAGEGTVFLDEIDKAPAALQAKLLRVLEDRQVLPVGSSAPVPLRARLLFAANRDLQSLVERGDFLPDLFYRLAGIKLVLPPLRERPEDVSALVRFVLQKMEGVHRDEPYVLSKSAREAIQAYDWPGNVRELRHVLEAATFFARADGVIDLLHLPEAIRSTYERDRFYGLPQLIEQLERREIVRALERSEGNKTQAARILGVTRKGLGDRIRRLGLES
ncbi:MAG: sigma 54-interacting transcriptional regulator [Gemmatimonadetes bacterium]|nr:sigma 54-interacting transcriptional regulator [Gemmatimonadota bacterium]